MAFAGEYNATIDDKGRVVLPSAFKKAMGDLPLDSLIVERNDTGKCLDIHPEKSWKKRVKDFKSDLDPFDAVDDAMLQYFFRSFTQIGMAANGRINIPNEYLKFASLVKSVKFIGMDTSIRLIAAGDTEIAEMSPEEFLSRLREKGKKKKKKKK